MRRRALLATGSALLTSLAGCTGLGGTQLSGGVGQPPTARLDMAPIEDAEIPPKVCYPVTREYDSGVQTEESRLVEEMNAGGAATVEATRPPIPTDTPVAYEESVYELAVEVTEEVPATVFHVKIDIVNGDESGERVRFSDLPEVDQRVFEREGYADGETVGIGTSLLYTDAEVEGSALVPETDIGVIEWASGNEAEWVVDGSHDTSLKTYRYTVEERTPIAEFGATIRERFEWGLSGLSEAERDIVSTAIEEGAYVVGTDETPSDAMVSLAARFRGRTEVDRSVLREGTPTPTPECTGDDCAEPGAERDVHGRFLVRYEGTVHWTYLLARGEAFAT